MSLHSDTLFRFRANQSWLFLLNVACCGQATHTNLIVFGLPRPGSNPRSTTLDANTLVITPSTQLMIVWQLALNTMKRTKAQANCALQTDKICLSCYRENTTLNQSINTLSVSLQNCIFHNISYNLWNIFHPEENFSSTYCNKHPQYDTTGTSCRK